jgi:beta-mannanase
VTDPEQWQEAWRRVVGIARGQGATNVAFVFCTNTNDVGGVPAEAYWPGAEWVDVVGVDGYNWGWDAAGRPQVTAEQVIGPMYRRLTALHPTAEFVVGEIGCAAGPGKAAWHEALYRSRRFPRLTRVAYFHEAKEQDWRLDSDEATLRVHRRYLARAPR